MKHLKHPFFVSKTFEKITPESAEQGMPSDHGFVFERTEMSAEDLIKEIDSIDAHEMIQIARENLKDKLARIISINQGVLK